MAVDEVLEGEGNKENNSIIHNIMSTSSNEFISFEMKDVLVEKERTPTKVRRNTTHEEISDRNKSFMTSGTSKDSHFRKRPLKALNYNSQNSN